MEVEDTSTSKSALEKPPDTPEMSAQDAEAMANSMLRDSPLPDSERGTERIPEDGGSDKLPEDGEGDKLSGGGGEKQPGETPAGKLVPSYRKGFYLLAFSSFRFSKYRKYCREVRRCAQEGCS